MSRLSVKEAALALGITPRAVRLRIEEKRIPATMLDGKWFVDLEGSFPPSPTGRQEVSPTDYAYTTDETPDEEVPSSIPPSPEGRQEVAVPAQFQLIMDQWVNPLVSQIREQAVEIGQLQAKLEESERQRLTLVDMIEEETYPVAYREEEPYGIWNAVRRFFSGKSDRKSSLDGAD